MLIFALQPLRKTGKAGSVPYFTDQNNKAQKSAKVTLRDSKGYNTSPSPPGTFPH